MPIITCSDRLERAEIIAATATFFSETMQELPEELGQALAQLRASRRA